MAKKRKTAAEKRAEQDRAERRAQDLFDRQLNDANTYLDAKRLAHQPMEHDAPGKHLYSNLAWFLGEFIPPFDGSRHELELYVDLIKRLDEGGGLKPGACEKVLANLEQAIKRAI